MKRQSTTQRHEIAINSFLTQLRCGKDYTVLSMYEEAGKEAFLEGHTVANVVRDHFNKEVITPEMIEALNSIQESNHRKTVSVFASAFNLCERESHLIIRYIRRKR